MKNYGYIRCSTAKSQGRQDTARQRRDIKSMCDNEVIFYEDYMSRSKVERKGYKTMLSDCPILKWISRIMRMILPFIALRYHD